MFVKVTSLISAIKTGFREEVSFDIKDESVGGGVLK